MSLSAAVIGATGLIGKLLLPSLVESPHFSTVGEFGRRVTTPAPNGTAKLVQRVIDFENLSESGLQDGAWDVVYITLGTTRALAGSMEAFSRIDKDYVVNAARQARVPGRKQRLVYLSSYSANPKSFIPYSKSKGLTELELAQIGYDDFIVLRPGMFRGVDRSGTARESESHSFIATLAQRFLTGADVQDIVAAVRLAGELGAAGLPSGVVSNSHSTDPKHPHVVLENDAVIALGKSAK